MPKLTMRFVESLITNRANSDNKPLSFYRDDELQGFGIAVRATCLSCFVESRVNGVNRRVTIGKHGKWSPDAARKQALVILGNMAAGHDPVKMRQNRKTVSLTLEQAFAEYMESKEFRHNTRLSFGRAINQNLADWLRKPVTSICKDMVEDRFRQLSSGSKKGTSGKANANLTMQVLRATLNYVSLKYEVDGEPLLAINPVSRLTQARCWHRLPQRQGTIPDHKLAQWAKAVQNLGNPTARDYYFTLLLTGLRRNEAAQLEWRDIDLGAKTLTVRAELSKSGHEHRLPISTFIYDVLSRRHAQRNGSEYVFTGYRGRGRYYGCYDTLKKLRSQ